MKREAVQDFLNLPGIAGVALVDGRSRPYFCGVDQTLNFQQKEALAQGIQQVIETTPADFDVFEFQFSEHQVYIYKLNHGIILLVLADSDLVFADYGQVITQLKLELQNDITNAIANFRLLAGNITLSKHNYWKSQSNAIANKPDKFIEPAQFESSSTNALNGKLHPSQINSSQTNNSQISSPVTTDLKPDLKELLIALNHFSSLATQYLGPTMVANYWQASRPNNEWLDQFQVDRTARIMFVNQLSSDGSLTITSDQHQWLQTWVKTFIERCSKVIRDFPRLVNTMNLTDRQKALLLFPLS
jgi:hypothetical protein